MNYYTVEIWRMRIRLFYPSSLLISLPSPSLILPQLQEKLFTILYLFSVSAPRSVLSSQQPLEGTVPVHQVETFPSFFIIPHLRFNSFLTQEGGKRPALVSSP